MSDLAWKRSSHWFGTAVLSSLVLLFTGGQASAQNFNQLPATQLYQVQTAVPSSPIVEIGNHACSLIAETLNGPTYVPPGTTQWYEYTNPLYRIDAERGPGCAFDIISHGGMGGYPEGHIRYDWFGQNWVLPLNRCPLGYNAATQQNPDGTTTQLCNRNAFAESKSSCPVHVGNPISCDTGKKIERANDTSFGNVTLTRTMRSGLLWPDVKVSRALGEGWYSLITSRLAFTPATLYSSAVVYAFRPDGTVIPFLPVSASMWTAEADLAGNTLMEVLDASNARIGWKFITSDELTEHYDIKGNLVAVERNGLRQMTLERDSVGRLLSISDSNSRKATVRHDASQRIDRIDLPDGQALTYGYDAKSRMESVTRAGSTTRYEYADIAGMEDVLLSKVIDENNSIYAEYGYDPNGNANLTQHAGGVDAYSLTYRNGGNDVDVVFPTGRTETYTFNLQMAARKLIATTTACTGCPMGTATRTYDGNGFPNLTTDLRGVTTDRDYNVRGLEVQRIEAANDSAGKKRTMQTDWHTSFRVPTERRTYNAANTLVAKSNWTYNTRGQVLTQTQTDPVTSVARTTTTSYCEQADITAGNCPLLGLIKSVDGPRTDVSDITTFTYRMADEASCASSLMACPYRKGDVWKTTNALNQVIETLKYDGAGRVLSVKDANAVITDLEYHPRGWLTARKVRGANAAVETDDQITRIEYWPTGLVKKVTQPDNAFTSYTYDAAHRLTDISDNASNTIHYTLDNAGNKTQEDTKDVQGTLRRTLSRVYNQLGQLQTQKDALQQPTGFTYDANGNTNTVTDALTRVTDNDYDPLNRLSRTLQDVGGINAQTSFQYDALDNLTQVTDPKGLNTGYSYNGLGDLLQLSSPDTGTTTYTYDSGGNRKTQVDARSKTATYSYDVLNRLIGISYPTTSLNVTYTYDTSQTVCATGETFSKGRLTRLKDASGTTQYCFDRFGQLVRKVQTTNAKVFTLRYAYTLGGRLQSVTYPNGTLVDYVRNTQGQVSEVGVTPAGATRQVLLSQATYAPFGPATGWTYGNGRTLQRTLNQNYQPNVISDAAPGGLSLGYAFDPVGNLATLRTAQQTDPPLATYGYDALSRLSDVRDGPTGTVIEHYAYDPTGNRQSVTNAGTTTAYTYPADNHRLSAVGSVARGYDAVGNTTQIGGTARQFVYNDAGRMSQVKAGSTVTMNYVTNGKGEQVRKYLGTANTYTVYDEAGHWFGDYNSAGAPIQQAIWLDDMPVGVLVGASTSQKLHYLEPDHLGTPRVVIDPVRNVAVWNWELKGEAFGATVPNQNPDNDANQFVFNMRFSGQRYDAASGLNYNYFRDYEPVVGRYAQSDPIGLIAGVSTYAYVSSNALTATDSLGLRKVILFGPQDQYFLDAANSYKDNPNICAVYAHGGRFHLKDGRGDVARRIYDENELAELLIKEGCTKDMSVVLYSCNAANGDNTITERLAKSGRFRGAAGPSNFIWYTPDTDAYGPKFVYGEIPGYRPRMDLSTPGIMWVYP